MATDPSSIFDRCYERALSAGHPAESHTDQSAESHTGHPADHSAERGAATKTGGVLAGLRVLETATVLAGPAVGMFLAECGARVLKLEPPTGDVTRQWTLPEENPSQGRSAYFCSVNWGKASLQSHLNEPDEQAVFRLLLAEADLLISNNLPHQEKDLGLDWEVLHALNPRLIAARINGYGSSSSRPGYDSLVQAESG
jgi:crotonobetainyl-CoA:carnitine CoA-transferase CaiB-like acyl-CoA transferase